MFRQEDLDALECRTRAQSSCKLWYDHRQGSLTASNFGDGMSHCRSCQSSKALVKRLCGPSYSPAVKLPAPLRWGRDHEGKVLELMLEHLRMHHMNVTCQPAGLMVPKDKPYLGASPDAILTCGCPSCPEKRLVEAKCPFTIRDKSPLVRLP